MTACIGSCFAGDIAKSHALFCFNLVWEAIIAAELEGLIADLLYSIKRIVSYVLAVA
jgi:hypothetical protein